MTTLIHRSLLNGNVLTVRSSTADVKASWRLSSILLEYFSYIQEMNMKACGHITQIHNTHVKMLNKFTKDMEKVRLRTGRRFSWRNLFISHDHDNSLYANEKLLVTAVQNRFYRGTYSGFYLTFLRSILAEVLRGPPQPLQANTYIVCLRANRSWSSPFK
jgi:hypothetical protein